jgi:DNA invertase Pin-like site-specific DNA recombinase
MTRYFAYCRKSTEDEDHQVLSIESQREELLRYAEREKLQVLELHQEAKSAKAPGRAVFNELLRRIEAGEADGILAWHPDRLARNALDGGRIIHLLDMGNLESLKFPTYTFENTSQGKFMLAIMFGQSKYYVDSLAENVRRGNRAKRERGWRPGMAPLGYINARSESGEKIIVPDPVRFPVLQGLWKLFLSGGYSVPQLLRIATADMGLRTPKRRRIGGSSLSVSGIYRIFNNPFYTGQIVYQGQVLPGKHTPMITLAEFARAQALLGKVDRPRPKAHEFAYTGLMRCGTCGGSITAERKTNRYGYRYVYYHCTHKIAGKPCSEKCIEERELERQIVAFLRRIHLDDKEICQALTAVEEERDREHGLDGSAKEALEAALRTCERNLESLTKLRYRELITDDEFVKQRAELGQEALTLKGRLASLSTEQWIEPSRNLFSFSNRAVFWLTHGTATEKRLILSTIGSNLTVTAKKLNIDARNPFVILGKRDHISTWCTIVNDVRAFFRENPEISIPELPKPRGRRKSAFKGRPVPSR